MLTFDPGETLTDEEIEFHLRSSVVECADPASIDQADLRAFALGPVSSEVAAKVRAHLDRCDYCSALSSEYRRMWIEERRRHRFIRVVGGGSLAAAAALIGFLVLTPSRAILRAYEAAEVHGMIAKTMAASEAQVELPPQPWHFAPSSPIELALRPREEHGAGLVPEVAVFTAAKDGALVRAREVSVTKGDDREYPVLAIAATGERVFGDQVGACALIVALAADAKTLDSIEGKNIAAARASGAQLLIFDTIYEK